MTHSDQDCLVPGQFVLTSTIVPINVLIDTGCMQTNVLSERIGDLLRKDGGKDFETDVALASGVGGVSYAVQGIMTLMVERRMSIVAKNSTASGHRSPPPSKRQCRTDEDRSSRR